MEKYIHESFNPTMETATQIIKKATEFPQLRLKQVIYINEYEAVCIFSYLEKPEKIVIK
jgi:hypothetical protein